MGKSQRLREGEVRAVYRLLSDLRELRHDAPEMHRHLIDSLVSLTGSTGGYVGDVSGWLPPPPDDEPWDLQLKPLALAEQGQETVAWVMKALAYYRDPRDDPSIVAGTQRRGTIEIAAFHRMGFTAPQLRRDYALFAQVTKQAHHVDHLFGLFQKRGDGVSVEGDVFGVSLHRYGHGEKRFSDRELAMLRLLFDELHWLHVTGRLTPVTPAIDKLPPRVRQVLEELLAGSAPKQIAQKLGLSVHTVREHIQRLYALTETGGRHELMSKYMRTHAPTSPPTPVEPPAGSEQRRRS